jgi:hypothetical protein
MQKYQKIEAMRKRLAIKEQKENPDDFMPSFQPQINKKSRELAAHSPGFLKRVNNWNEAKMTKQKIERIKKDH